MPIIQSAKKRVRSATKATIRNAKTKRAMREAIKSFRATLATKADSSRALSEAQQAIDTAVKKNVLHKNRAAREKRQLVAEAKAAGVKLTAKPAKKTPAKKPASSTAASSSKAKPAAKKTPAKKPASTATAKKAPAKKPAAKKTPASKSSTKKTTK